MITEDVTILIARLLTHRFLPRSDPLAVRALTDEAFRQELESHLTTCGLELLDNPYADNIAVGLVPRLQSPVFGREDHWDSNNLGLHRDAVALLMVIWALLILPKRQRQIERNNRAEAAGQAQMFAEQKPIPRGKDAAEALAERTLIADFGERLGTATQIKKNLGQLRRLGFIIKRNEAIYEGPLLDLALDYSRIANRILDGALSEMLMTNPAGNAEKPDV